MEGFQVDELKLYFGDNIKIADGITICQPTIGDIVQYGEQEYFAIAQNLCATPSSLKVQLDDMKLDYMQVKDFELFAMLCQMQAFPQDKTKILLGDLDLTTLKPYSLRETEELVLTNEDHSIVINEIMYNILTTYLRKMHGFTKQVDKAANAITRKVLIDEDRKALKRNKDKPYKSFLQPLISAVKCRQKYSLDYIKSMGIFELMDDLNRLNVIINADAALNGSFSGFCDTKKMDKDVFNWTRDLSDDKNKQKNNKTTLKEGAN